MLGNKGENNMLNGLPWYAWVVIFVLGVLVCGFIKTYSDLSV